MRYFTALLLLVAFNCTLPACAQPAQPPTQKVKSQKASKKAAAREARLAAAKAKNEVGPVLTFERTRCFGKCPAYVMQVFADGRVAYEGRRDVPVMGPKEFKLPTATVADMLRTAKEAHFDQFEDRYSRHTSDLPSVVVSIRQSFGQLKTVSVEEGEPANVRMFITYLATQFDSLAQVGGVDK